MHGFRYRLPLPASLSSLQVFCCSLRAREVALFRNPFSIGTLQKGLRMC